MARPQKLKNPRAIVLHVEAELKDEWDNLRGRLSWGEFFTAWYARQKDVIKALVRIEALEQEVTKLEKENSELKKLVQKVQQENEKLKLIRQVLEEDNRQLKAQLKEGGRDREAKDLHKEVQRILSTYSEIKLLELFRRLGYSEKGEALMKKAEAFQKRWFVLEGRVFVSKELGVVLEPSEHVGMLGWKVRRLEVKA